MAWNEPGNNSNSNNTNKSNSSNNSNNQENWNNKSNDPWGRRPSNDGPPDLDEALRKMQNALNEIFGGNKKNTNNSGGGRKSNSDFSPKILWLVAVAVVSFLWLFNAVYVIDEQEQAVILRLGKYHRTVNPGLNVYLPPFEKKFQENVTRERAYTKQGQMLTEDENIIEVPLTVQYKISNLKDFVLNVDQPELSLQQSTDSAVRHVVGSTSMDKVLTEGREVMASEVKERLQGFIDNYQTGITITQVNIQSAAAPREVQDAFDDVIRAREEEQREKNKAESYANGVIPEARGKAQRILEDASGYRDESIAKAQGDAERFSKLLAEYKKAPGVTRERLYLETIQEVMSNTSKVLISGEQGKNSLLYLPLDKIIKDTKAPTSNTNSQSNSINNNYVAPPNMPIINTSPNNINPRTRGNR